MELKKREGIQRFQPSPGQPGAKPPYESGPTRPLTVTPRPQPGPSGPQVAPRRFDDVKRFRVERIEKGGSRKVIQEPGSEWRVFTHVNGLTAKDWMNVDGSQMRTGYGPGKWKAGDIVRDEQTVVLKRGLMRSRDLWRWFDALAGGRYAPRLKVTIELRGIDGRALMRWALRRALPVRFKTADFNARANEVGVEELHLVHEGLEHEEQAS